jgi:signal transduction histidine kinase
MNENNQDDLDFLVNEVKELRKERVALLRQLRDERNRSDKNISGQLPFAELSRITDGIVHDMRNGMGIIRNTISFMNENLVNTSYEKDILKISRSLDFCEVVLRNLSALGGQDIFSPEWVNLEILIHEICFMLENKLADVKLVVEVDADKPMIMADKGNMKQVFMNLIKNAGEAMPDGGVLTFRIYQESDMMCIDITDTGRGISPENQNKLFKDLFTTKELGYGIGLFVVHTIVERHDGKINVVSEVGKGTRFILQLPVEGK